MMVALVAFASGAGLLRAQQVHTCMGKCEWEFMMQHLLQDPSAISGYDLEDMVLRADLHHLSYMAKIVNMMPMSVYDETTARQYADFISLVIKEFGNKADFLKEVSAGRQVDLSMIDNRGDIMQTVNDLRFVAQLLFQITENYYFMSQPGMEKMNYGNMHFLERALYGSDVVMAAKDPYYAETMMRLCDKMDLVFDIDASEGDILACLMEIAMDADLEAFSEIWKDLIRLRLCVNILWQGDLNTLLIAYAQEEIGFDEYLLEFGKAVREYHSDEFSKMLIPLYSLRTRSMEEMLSTSKYIDGLLKDGKPYAEYLPWACPEECRTDGFNEYREAYLRLSKVAIRSLGYEINTAVFMQNGESAAPLFRVFGVSNLSELVYVIGSFALDMIYEGYNDAYTIVEDVFRLAQSGYYDPYLMARVAIAYTEVSYNKVEMIIDEILIPCIEHRVEEWVQGAETPTRIDAMLMTALAGMTVNKDKYLSMATRYVLEISEFVEKLPAEDRTYFNLHLTNLYSLMGMGDMSRELITHDLRELFKSDPDQEAYAMFASYYELGDYDNAVKYAKPAIGQEGITYVISAMETSFRTGQYRLASRLSETYLQNRHMMSENLFLVTSEDKSDLSALYRKYDIKSLTGVLETSYGKSSCADCLAGLLYDWSLISKGELLRSMTDWHGYMMENDDKLFGMYDLYNAFSSDAEEEGAWLHGAYANAASFELSDQLRSDYVAPEETPRVTSKDVSDGLGRGSYAVEFCNISDVYYASLVGKGHKAPELYRLCSKDDILSVSEDIFTEYLYDDTVSLKELYDLVWEPVLNKIPEGSDIYCSLDGLLNLLNVELFCDDSMRYVGDVYDIHRVSTTASIKEPVRMADLSGAVLYGDLNYFMNRQEISYDSDKYVYNAAEAKYRGAVMDYVVPREPLQETGEEIRKVAEILSENQVDTLVFEWNKGTELSFKSLSGRDFDVLHMATHGFWWGSETDADGKYVPPMRRSGLVLAGSDMEPLSSDKAGVLMAQEIAELDLSSVDLLVLSACQTAGGEIQEDGVFGLQRGFKQAGVGTIVMTLWPVISDMTRELMTLMYENLAKGQDARDAFYSARKEIRRHYKKASDWGAFIILD